LQSMGTGRTGFAAAALGRRIYVLGGRSTGTVDASTALFASAEIYNAETGHWASMPPMAVRRDNLAAAAVGGRIYAIGGFSAAGSSQSVLRTVEVYDPAAAAWTSSSPMLSARQSLAAATVCGRIYAVGGCVQPGDVHASADVYDPTVGTWSALPPMSTRRKNSAAAVAGGRLFVFGGRGPANTALPSCEVFDPAVGAWSDLPPMMPLRRVAATAAGGRIYVFGGGDGQVDTFDPEAGAWTSLPPLGTSRTGASVVTLLS